MPLKHSYFIILGLLYGLTILHSAYFYSLLPDMIGNRYDFDGTVIRLHSKQVVVGLYMFVSCFPLLLFSLISRVSFKNANLPNRDYWLKEENVGKAHKLFKHSIFKFSVALMLFWISIFHQIFRAGINNNQMNNMPTYIIFGLFALFTIFWMINLFQEFKIPEDHKTPPDQEN